MTTAAIPQNKAFHQKLSTWVGRPAVWIAFFSLWSAILVGRAVLVRLPPPLPVLSTVPAFALTDQHGNPFGSKDLAGKVWVANFIFTRCPTICPMFTAQMAKLQHRSRGLGEHIHLVSISVDPEHDTPATLLAYATKHRHSPRMWSFLTGDKAEIRSLVVDGLKIHMSNDGPADDLMSIAHGSHFVLVDPQMRVRGYYDSNDPGAVDKVIAAAGLLANRGE